MESTLTINYHGGKGSLTLDMAQFFPCTKGDFNKILSMLAEDPYSTDKAESIGEYFRERIGQLKEDAKNMWGNAAKRAKADSEKLAGLLSVLCKRYHVDNVESTETGKITLKKADFYSLIGNNGNPTVQMLSGFTFQNGGITFAAYKKEYSPRHKTYIIILPSMGLQCATAKKRAEIIDAITPDLLGLIRKKIASGEVKKSEEYFSMLCKDAIESEAMPYLEKAAALLASIAAQETAQEAEEKPTQTNTADISADSVETAEKPAEAEKTGQENDPADSTTNAENAPQEATQPEGVETIEDLDAQPARAMESTTEKTAERTKVAETVRYNAPQRATNAANKRNQTANRKHTTNKRKPRRKAPAIIALAAVVVAFVTPKRKAA